MKITILNGNPQPTAFDEYLTQLTTSLESTGHQITRLDLRDMTLRYCVGCWGCWVKTPGECVNHDASLDMDRAVINADFVLWASPLKMGFPTELLKRAHDKHLPLIHPYMEVDQGEAHHLKRYARYPRVGLLLEKETSTDIRDLQIVTDIHCRTALNFKTRLEFSLTTESPADDLVRRIISPAQACLPLPKRMTATSGVTITPPKRLTLFNGSPRGRKGNTPFFLREIASGFGGESETHHLVRIRETEQMVQVFGDAECVIFGFPLYTDSMPGVVKHFIEALEPLTGRATNPAIGFVVQSGFPEGLHSRYVERYLERLAERLHSPYLGTVVKGNGEGVRIMPEEANKQLFANLQAIGSSLATSGNFDTAALKAISHPEQFPRILGPVFQLFVRLPIAHQYFDEMLKRNGVFRRRFARPFLPE
jgi:multimeric flavodoxin WrbA